MIVGRFMGCVGMTILSGGVTILLRTVVLKWRNEHAKWRLLGGSFQKGVDLSKHFREMIKISQKIVFNFPTIF